MTVANAKICVIGAGTMGRGIAQVALGAGHDVVIVDPSEAQRASARDDILTRLGRKMPDSLPLLEGRLSGCAELGEVESAGPVFVVEAGPEDLAIKRSILQRAQDHFGDTAVLATNTSSLSITELAAGLPAPGQVIGMHFFNPVPVMALVEVIDGLHSDPRAVEAVAEMARSWGKTVVRVRSAPGFIVNRVARPFYGESLRLLEERAAEPREIDELLRAAGGFRMGPFELIDLIGVDVNLTVTRTVWTAFHFDPRFAPSHCQAELVAAGFLGRKSGRGFYQYGEGVREDPCPPSEAVATLPHRPVLRGRSDELEAVLRRAGIEADHAEGPGLIDLGAAGVICITRGRTAGGVSEELGRPVAVLDRCLDPESVSALSVAGTDPEIVALAVTLLRAAEISAYPIEDVPGMVVARVVSMIINEAYELALQGGASPHDIDAAMVLGTGYPRGPFRWADEWGPDVVLGTLDALADAYRDPRYRPSRRLQDEVGAASRRG